MTAHTAPPFILASESPRRRELLREAGYRFEVIPPDPGTEAGGELPESAAELVLQRALRKAENVAERVGRGIVIGCDTVVECQGHILGKPRDRDDAERMLRTLRGNVHYVYSGLCLWRQPENLSVVDVDVTRLRMDDVSEGELQAYVDSDAWQGKAGAFGYQDRLGWIHIEEGSVSNVVGLPMELLQRLLPTLG